MFYIVETNGNLIDHPFPNVQAAKQYAKEQWDGIIIDGNNLYFGEITPGYESASIMNKEDVDYLKSTGDIR